jgi:hypothetical protein
MRKQSSIKYDEFIPALEFVEIFRVGPPLAQSVLANLAYYSIREYYLFFSSFNNIY